MDENEIRQRATERVGELKSFRQHLFIFFFVNLFLFTMDYLREPDEWWFYWPLIGWGIGLLSHWFSVYGFWGRDWEEKKTKEIMDKMKNNK